MKTLCVQNISCLGVHGATSAPTGDQSCNFFEKTGNFIFLLFLISSVSLFMASNKLLFGCNQKMSMQAQVRCLMPPY